VFGSRIYVVSDARKFDGRVVRANGDWIYRVDWFDHKIHRTFDDRALDATTPVVSSQYRSGERRKALGFRLVSVVSFSRFHLTQLCTFSDRLLFF
jgi:hypothetical protein